MEDISSYILNDKNMISYLKYKIQYGNNKKNTLVKKPERNENAPLNKEDYFFPKENDTLFWCYFLIVSGETDYEMISVRNILVEKQNKIKYISDIRENKQILKTYKFDTLTNIENNLANDNIVNIKTIMSLFSIKNINVIFVSSKNTYFELLLDSEKPIYIIKEIDNKSKYNKKYGYKIGSQDEIDYIRNNAYKTVTLDKPIKSASSYKVQDLIDICNKLSINVKNELTGKNKTKDELYQLLLQYF